ncbi:AAA family ATPase [Desulfomicrobium sp. ZS1]|uniref:ATP-binding protein n=1 Tax=Desulfomicrobium sp. ZS1 TaxID=2952228 RepID=UPI0020B3A48D|nr:YhaN family protein [Desulfomicrobium sp. ZS1]UTF51882.1 AAA family ATPase [Desulfomicrobium sp. ZS1]
MIIKRLEFKAYGPFSDRGLDFDSALPGLHIVHGPNEAGKSSAMRALQALLFGFPLRTGDNFLHPYDQLLVGGCLSHTGGGELCFYRRKKNKNDLFDAKDQPLPPDALAPFLQGLGQDLFASMYGINHETLVQGGQGILDQQGEVGQALFAAGAGFASLKSVLAGLDAEADELFRPRGVNKAITQALGHYKELQARLRGVSLGSQEWQRQCASLAQAEDELRLLTERSQDLKRELHLLERLSRSLPFLTQRRLYLEKLQAMGEVVPLPEDFGMQRRRLEEELRAARARLHGTQERLAELHDRQAAIGLNRGVLNLADDIEDLHLRLGEYRKGLLDRPRLEGMRIAFKTEASNLLRRIRPDLDVEQAESLRPGLAKRKTVQGLGQRHEAVRQEVRQAEDRLREVRRELGGKQAELAALGQPADVISLFRAVNEVLKKGDLDAELRSRQDDLLRIEAGCQAALQRLGLWNGTFEEALRIGLPLPETVNEFEAALQSADEELRLFSAEEDKTVQALTVLHRDLRAIEHAAVVPSETELQACRARREQGWTLLRRQWLNGEDVAKESSLYAPEHPLPEAYEHSVTLADRTADRMYREADRVQKHAQLLAGIETAEAALAGLRQRREAAQAAKEDLLARWLEQWAGAGIVPRGPREMRAWIVNFEALRLQVEELGRTKAEFNAKQRGRQELRALLAQELALVGEEAELPGAGLDEALRRAQAVAERLRDGSARRETLQKTVCELDAAAERAEAGLDTARRNLEEWRAAWEEALGFMGLSGNPSPAEAADYVDTVQECLAKLHEESELRKRLKGIDRDGQAFENRVRELVALVAPDAARLDAALAVAQMKGLLGQAVREHAVWSRQEEEIAALDRQVLAVREELRTLEEGMAALRAQSRCDDDECMILAERRFADYAQVRSKLDEVESNLAAIAEGGTLEDLEAQACAQDVDALPGKIAALRTELEEEIDPRIRPLAEKVGQEKNELARMNGDDAAARIAEEMQETLAGISRMTDRYIRLRLASRVLRAEIERFRAANQGPLLAIASDLFAKLTLGSFAGLRADIDEADRPVLIGVREGGLLVKVEGMSSGTRDQLYLALRLASLELRSKTTEPMPFIVDDILINFDEERSHATLEVFAAMAERTQIIMFTHQARIAELARSLGREDRVFVHGL